MKLFKWITDNILFIFSLFLLALIPLYPKLPILDIAHTWVYVRAEDFVVVLALLIWVTLLFAKKITLKTPLTLPIVLFWIVGAISTLHGLLLIFPNLDNMYPNVALLSYLRRIEYLSLFFIGFAGVKDKRLIPYVTAVLSITLLLVVAYGIGQKYYGFPAFLTMNEEFAKGIPIKLSPLSRVSSTFGGHYDLAAYLVLIIPILSSMVFGFRNWFIKVFLMGVVVSGFVLLFMTVSRSSFFVLLLSMIFMLFLQKRKLAIAATVISCFVVVFISLTFSTSLFERFGNTVKKIDVLVDAQSGEPIGHLKEVESSGFENKPILLQSAQSTREIFTAIAYSDTPQASFSAATLTLGQLPPIVPLVTEPNIPTGEDLPQGTGYVNLPLTPISNTIGRFYYQKSDKKTANTNKIIAIQGDFLVKKVTAYDLSFTTRFQGEWPKTLELFRKNIVFGGGYSSTGLAVDNNYLRILGEVGLLGFLSYFSIILIALIYIKKVLPSVDSYIVKSFVYGFIAGAFGLALNAVLIDVFEASKIAFTFWLLMGIILGTLHLYNSKNIDLFKEFKKAISSNFAIIVYLIVVLIIAYSSITNYFFVGDDFTWLRWVVDCRGGCAVFDYFTNADGFFYRPGTKVYFLLMYSSFWLNQAIYHMVSIFLHIILAVLVFLISKKILKDFLFSAIAAFLFIILSGYAEAVFWIASTGHLFNAVFILLSLLFYIFYKEKQKNIFLIFSLISIIFSLLFHELGIIAPLIIILYECVFREEHLLKGIFKKINLAIFLLPVLPYLTLRYLANSHWLNGDYSYNLFNLPFNFVGNTIGYLMLSLFGSQSLPFYQLLRNFSKENTLYALISIIVAIFIVTIMYKIIISKMAKEDKKIMVFGFMFFVISLLPFLGLGNITSRYSYLSAVGFVLLFVFFLKKLYSFVNSNNSRDIAIAIILVIISIFSLVHIIQLQKIKGDWIEAGKKSNRFIISLDDYYQDSWTKEKMNFYFVNVPIKNGDAWVFPVGLKDAVWFVFRNDNINVYQLSSEEEALNQIKDVTRDKVFVFNDDGSVTEKKSSKLLLP